VGSLEAGTKVTKCCIPDDKIIPIVEKLNMVVHYRKAFSGTTILRTSQKIFGATS
jgi:hypothetical protein